MGIYSVFWIAYLVTYFFTAAGLAFIPAGISKGKGRSMVGWWFFGFGVFPVALILSICLPRAEEEPAPAPTTYTATYTATPGSSYANDTNNSFEKLK